MNSPSSSLMNVLSKKRPPDVVRKAVDLIKKEFEVYSFMSDRVPKNFTDDHWKRTLLLKTPKERVAYWQFIALNERKRELDKAKKEEKKEKTIAFREEERIKFENGLMGYGSGLYQLMFPPGCLEGVGIGRLAAVERLKDVPKIALDFQLVETESPKNLSQLRLQLMDLHSYQRLQSPYPLPFELINYNQRSEKMRSALKLFGYMDRKIPAPLSPPVAPYNPYKGRRDVVYISKHAREVLDGPLSFDTYILPVTYGIDKVCLSAALRDRIKPKALPLRKYIRWSGPINYPLVNVYKVLEIVARTGGDWELAIRSSYSKRYMMTDEEKQKLRQLPAASLALERQLENQEIVKMIEQGVPERISL
ncbi:unnamed protein product [Bursaphelenchus xylophilus]|uniref:(pine wood nematode) hypothetical protein n=1 Tax=Bursaphelenchus xylophilus TaxID=6326 RepID=A0A1I7RQV3_BURXY|nr:unnamed protein product [Bursaphelenchus xylophilus]CAG9130691.1 unnamed protein product [Bursaphelenchus xylophilus]